MNTGPNPNTKEFLHSQWPTAQARNSLSWIVVLFMLFYSLDFQDKLAEMVTLIRVLKPNMDDIAHSHPIFGDFIQIDGCMDVFAIASKKIRDIVIFLSVES